MIIVDNIIAASTNDSLNTFNGQITLENPKINKILKIFEPTAFPNANPLSPFLHATTLVTSSGKDVPIAIIVNPIKFSLNPNILAILHALSTTKFPP